MIPLEMKGMIRFCKVPIPMVGLHRNSGDAELTKIYYNNARRQRDIACFPSILRKNISRFGAYRCIRRLWIKVFSKLFKEIYQCCYADSLVERTMEYMSYHVCEKIPLIYSNFFIHYLSDDSLNIHVRFEQMAGRLVTLGYPKMKFPTVEGWEYEFYLYILSKCNVQDSIKLATLYNSLVAKNVDDKIKIMMTHFAFLTNPSYRSHYGIYANKYEQYLDACIKINTFTPTEVKLLEYWTSILKYPSKNKF